MGGGGLGAALRPTPPSGVVLGHLSIASLGDRRVLRGVEDGGPLKFRSSFKLCSKDPMQSLPGGNLLGLIFASRSRLPSFRLPQVSTWQVETCKNENYNELLTHLVETA